MRLQKNWMLGFRRSAIYASAALLSIFGIIVVSYATAIKSMDDTSSIDEPSRETIVVNCPFGVVPPHFTTTKIVSIRNQRNELWTLDSVKASCVCTVVEVSDRKTKRGENLELEVAFKSTDPSATRRSTLVVTFVEADAPIVLIRVSATPRGETYVSSEELKFDCSNGITPRSQRFRVRNYSDAGWDRIEIVSSVPWLSVTQTKVEATDGAIQEYTVNVTVKRGALGEGQHFGDLDISVFPASGKTPSLTTIPVTFEIAEAISCYPPQLTFVRKEIAQTQSVTVLLAEDKSIDVSEIELSHDFGDHMTVRLEHVDSNRGKITVCLNGAASASRGAIQIRVPNREIQAEVTVKVLAEIQ